MRIRMLNSFVATAMALPRTLATTLATSLLLACAVGFDGEAHADDRPLFATPQAAADAAARTETTAKPAKTSDSNEGTLAQGASKGAFLGEVLPTAAALGGTLLAIVVARSAVRRFGGRLALGKRPSGVVEILARYPVARGQQVVLLKVGRRVIVAHQGAQTMQPLSEFVSEEDVADIISRCEAGARGTREFSFDSILRQSGKKFDSAFETQDSSRATKAARIDPRDAMPAIMRGAEIETVDLTRTRRGGAR